MPRRLILCPRKTDPGSFYNGPSSPLNSPSPGPTRGPQTNLRPFSSMHRMLMFTGTTIGGLLGWWFASPAGILMAFIVSSLGSVLGLYVGWRIGRDYF